MPILFPRHNSGANCSGSKKGSDALDASDPLQRSAFNGAYAVRASHTKAPLLQAATTEIFDVRQDLARRFVVHLGDQSVQSLFGVADIEPVDQSV